MVSTSEVLAANPEAFVRLHKALIKAFDTFEHEQDESIKMMQNYLELDTEVLRADAYSRYSPNPEINVDAVQTFWDAMNEIKYIDSDLDIMDYVDETYYNTARCKCWKKILTTLSIKNSLKADMDQMQNNQ